MERVSTENTYREIVKSLLLSHAERINGNPQDEIETVLNFDDERDNYLLLSIGWTKRGRMLAPTICLRLRDSKVWVENDWTDAGVVDELLERDIPAKDIVLGFHSPEMRVHTEFAIA